MTNGSKRLATLAAAAGLLIGGFGVTFGAPEGKTDRPLKGPKAGPPGTQPARGAMRGERGDRMRHAMRELLADLNVTPEQHAQIKALADAHKQKMEQWRSAHEAELKETRKAHEAAREAGDRGKLRELRAKREELMKDAPKPGELFRQIRGVLTEEQQKAFDSRVEGVLEKMRQGRPGPGPGKGEGPRGEGRGGERRGKGGQPKPSGTGNKLEI